MANYKWAPPPKEYAFRTRNENIVQLIEKTKNENKLKSFNQAIEVLILENFRKENETALELKTAS